MQWWQTFGPILLIYASLSHVHSCCWGLWCLRCHDHCCNCHALLFNNCPPHQPLLIVVFLPLSLLNPSSLPWLGWPQSLLLLIVHPLTLLSIDPCLSVVHCRIVIQLPGKPPGTISLVVINPCLTPFVCTGWLLHCILSCPLPLLSSCPCGLSSSCPCRLSKCCRLLTHRCLCLKLATHLPGLVVTLHLAVLLC